MLQTSIKGAILFKDHPVRAFRITWSKKRWGPTNQGPHPNHNSHVKDKTVKPANLSKDETNCIRTIGSTNSQKTSIVNQTTSSISWNAPVVTKNYYGETKRNFLTQFKEHPNNLEPNPRSPIPHDGGPEKQRENVDTHITPHCPTRH